MSVFRDTSLILECPKCETINYLDPFSFWNFKGKVKCAGCGSIWAYELVNGTRTGPPAAAEGPHDKLPGYAQSKDWKPITEAGKVNSAPQAGFRSPAQARGPGRQPPEEIRDVIL